MNPFANLAPNVGEVPQYLMSPRKCHFRIHWNLDWTVVQVSLDSRYRVAATHPRVCSMIFRSKLRGRALIQTFCMARKCFFQHPKHSSSFAYHPAGSHCFLGALNANNKDLSRAPEARSEIKKSLFTFCSAQKQQNTTCNSLQLWQMSKWANGRFCIGKQTSKQNVKCWISFCVIFTLFCIKMSVTLVLLNMPGVRIAPRIALGSFFNDQLSAIPGYVR